MEVLFELLAELVLQTLGELVFTLGSESVAHARRRDPDANPILAAIGFVLLGAAAGLLTGWLVPFRVLPPPRWPGISLVVSPLVTGMIMHQYGRWRRARGLRTTRLATFWGGGLFALAFALGRLVVVGRG